MEDPVDLVKKYNEYVHGNPRGERRFVLDKYMLDDIFRARNLRVVSRRDLLGRLLGTLREQARIARRQQKQLLIIFVFAHGETKASGVSVGGERRHASAPILHMDAVNRLLPRDVSASLLITSCFSGGWLFRPDLTSSPGYFNVTGTAASSDEKESHSWPQSNNVGRASGSIAASAILQSLINVEEASEETTQHLTYIDLSHSIFESVKAMHRLGEEQQMHFPAENDEWEMHYQHRLGTPACLIQGTMGFPPRNPSILYPRW